VCPTCQNHWVNISNYNYMQSMKLIKCSARNNMQTLPQLMQQVTFQKSRASWILCKMEFCIHMVTYTSIYKGLSRWNLNSQHTGNWLATVWPPCCQCYQPAVFIHHLCLIALHPYKEDSAKFKKNISFFFL